MYKRVSSQVRLPRQTRRERERGEGERDERTKPKEF